MLARVVAASLMVVTASGAAAADTVTDRVFTFDPVKKMLVMQDRTVWSLKDLAEMPAGLKSGDRVTIDFKSDGDNGPTKVLAVRTVTQ